MKYLTTALLLFCLSNIYAQGLKLGGVEYLNFPNSAIVDATDGQEVAFQEFRAFVNIPIKMKNNKTILLNGLNYDFVQATLQNSPLFGSTDATKNLHSISYSLSMIQKWNKWTMLLQVKPTIASDFEEDLSDNDLLFQGTALLSRQIGHLGIGLGRHECCVGQREQDDQHRHPDREHGRPASAKHKARLVDLEAQPALIKNCHS